MCSGPVMLKHPSFGRVGEGPHKHLAVLHLELSMAARYISSPPLIISSRCFVTLLLSATLVFLAAHSHGSVTGARRRKTIKASHLDPGGNPIEY